MASAVVLGVTCTSGPITIDYAPGLTTTPTVQTFDASYAYDGCISLDPLTSSTGLTKAIVWHDAAGATVGTSTVSMTLTISHVAAGTLATHTGRRTPDRRDT